MDNLTNITSVNLKRSDDSSNTVDRNEPPSKKPAFDMQQLLPPHLSQHPVITSTAAFMSQSMAHRAPGMLDRQDMNGVMTSMSSSIPSSRAYSGHPMMSMPGQGLMAVPSRQDPSPWGNPSQYMSGPCMFGPMGPTANNVSPWGPPPTMVSTQASNLQMPSSRPQYTSPDPMSCRMYGVNPGDQLTDLDHRKQKETEPDMPKVLFSPAPIMNVQKDPKKKKPRKKPYTQSMSPGPGQGSGSGPVETGQLPGGSSDHYNDMASLGVGPIGPLGGYGPPPGVPWGQIPPQMNPGPRHQAPGPGMGMMGMNSMNPQGPSNSMPSDMYGVNSGEQQQTETKKDQEKPPEEDKNVIYSVSIVPKETEEEKGKAKGKGKDKGNEKDKEKGKEVKKRRRRKKPPQRAKVAGQDDQKPEKAKGSKQTAGKDKSKVIFSSSVFNIVQKEVKKKRKSTKPKRVNFNPNRPVAAPVTEEQLSLNESRLSNENRMALQQLSMLQKEMDARRSIELANQRAEQEGQLEADLASASGMGANSMVGRYSIVDALGTARGQQYQNSAAANLGVSEEENKKFALQQLGLLQKAIAQRAMYTPKHPGTKDEKDWQEQTEKYNMEAQTAGDTNQTPDTNTTNNTNNAAGMNPAEVPPTTDVLQKALEAAEVTPPPGDMEAANNPATGDNQNTSLDMDEENGADDEGARLAKSLLSAYEKTIGRLGKVAYVPMAKKAEKTEEGKSGEDGVEKSKGNTEAEKAQGENEFDDNIVIKTEGGNSDAEGLGEEDGEKTKKENKKKSCGCFACTKLRSGHCVSKYKGLNIKQYPCKCCDMIFEKRSTLNTHMKTHTGERPFRCEICGKGFLQDSNLVTHLMKHAGLKPYVCEECGKSFNMKSHLIKHRRVHTGEKPFQCEYCGKSFSENGSLVRHERKHTGEKPYKCDVCDKPFAETGSLHRHMKVHEEDRPYRCEVCYKSFKDDAPLVAHMMRHVGMRPYICEECGKSFNMKSHLIKHRRVHTGEKPFVCDMCGRSFSENGSLVRHKKRHLGVRPECCELCGKTFTEKVQLRRHMLTHTGEKPFTCKVCFKSFHDNCNLVTHMRIHTGSKPFKCDICSRAFNQKGNLVKHRETHMEKEEKPYKCEFCGKGFMEYESCARHMTFHTGDRKFKCDVCGRAFNAKRHLATHMRIHTGEKPFKCEFCGKHFKHDGSYFKHRRIHTGERPYKCELCEKTFRENSDLIKHMNVHSTPKGCNRIQLYGGGTGTNGVDDQKPVDPEDRPYKCEICGKAFKHELSLVNHWRVHSGERPFKCDLCDKTFKEKGHLSRHMRSHSKNKTPKAKKKRGHFGESSFSPKAEDFTALKNIPIEDIKPYKCEVCERSFRNNGDLVAHMWVHSGVERPYRVDNMSDSMNRNDHLGVQKLQHNSDRPAYKCEICEMSFRDNGDLVAHMWVHSGVERPYRVDNYAEQLNWNDQLLGQKHPMESYLPSHPIWPNMNPPGGLQPLTSAVENSVSSVVHFANSVMHRGAMDNKASSSVPVSDAGHSGHTEPIWMNHHHGHPQWPK